MPDPMSERNDALKEAMDARQAWVDMQNAKGYGHKEACTWHSRTGEGWWSCAPGCNADVKRATALVEIAQRIAMADAACWNAELALDEARQRYRAERER